MPLIFMRPVTQFPQAMEEHGSGQGIASLALVEPDMNPAAHLKVAHVLEQKDGPFQSTEFPQGNRKPVLPWIRAELSEHQRCRDGSVFDGGGEPENLVPVGENLFRVHRPTNERGKGWVGAGFLDCELASVADVPNSRCKSKSQEMAERENVVSESGGIGVVLVDLQFRFMVEQTVQNVCRITYGRADELGVERPVLVRDVGVKRHAGVVTVTRIYITQCISGSAGSESLPVRGTGGSVSPMPGEFQSVMMIHDFGERLAIGFFPDVPSGDSREFRE